MHAIYEAIKPQPGSSWAFLDRNLVDGIPFEWHHHPEYELTLTLNSRGYRYVGDDVDAYDDGDLILIGPGIPHSWHSREVIDPVLPHTALVIWFTQEWLAGLTRTLPELTQLSGILARASQGLRFSEPARQAVVTSIVAMRTATPVARLLLLLDVLNELSRDHEAVPLSNIPGVENPQLSNEPKIGRVLNYLHAHFAEPISAGDMAAIACISTSGFHRMFRRHTRTTLIGYLTGLRIGRACSLLIDSPLPISSIANAVGYSNLSLFNRQFTRIKGEPPSTFRKRHRVILGSLDGSTAQPAST